MTPFPGQISRMGLNGTQAMVWTDVAFYLKAFLNVGVRLGATFRGWVR